MPTTRSSPFPASSFPAPVRLPPGRARGPLPQSESLTSEEEAIARAAFDLTNFPYEASDFARATDPPDSGPYRFYEYKPKDDDGRPPFTRLVRLKDVMFPLSEGQFTFPPTTWNSGLKDFRLTAM